MGLYVVYEISVLPIIFHVGMVSKIEEKIIALRIFFVFLCALNFVYTKYGHAGLGM